MPLTLPVALYGVAADDAVPARQAAVVTRQLRLLRAHGLIVKVQKNSQEAGHPWAALSHHLDDRFVAEVRMPSRV